MNNEVLLLVGLGVSTLGAVLNSSFGLFVGMVVLAVWLVRLVSQLLAQYRASKNPPFSLGVQMAFATPEERTAFAEKLQGTVIAHRQEWTTEEEAQRDQANAERFAAEQAEYEATEDANDDAGQDARAELQAAHDEQVPGYETETPTEETPAPETDISQPARKKHSRTATQEILDRTKAGETAKQIKEAMGYKNISQVYKVRSIANRAATAKKVARKAKRNK